MTLYCWSMPCHLCADRAGGEQVRVPGHPVVQRGHAQDRAHPHEAALQTNTRQDQGGNQLYPL